MYTIDRAVLISSFCLLFFLSSVQSSSQGCPSMVSFPSIKDFRNEVNSLFEELSLNDAPLSIINVELANYPSGIAFAHFLPETQKKYILINYNYLHRKLSEESNYTLYWSVIVVTILAHEWAHHYLGHTFEKANKMNERSADIITGRIVEEYMTTKCESILKKIEPLSTLASFFQSLPRGKHHFSGQVRKALIDKGANTYQILNSKMVDLIKEYENNIEDEEQRLKRELENYEDERKDIKSGYLKSIYILVNEYKTKVDSIKSQVFRLIQRDSTILSNPPVIDTTSTTHETTSDSIVISPVISEALLDSTKILEEDAERKYTSQIHSASDLILFGYKLHQAFPQGKIDSIKVYVAKLIELFNEYKKEYEDLDKKLQQNLDVKNKDETNKKLTYQYTHASRAHSLVTTQAFYNKWYFVPSKENIFKNRHTILTEALKRITKDSPLKIQFLLSDSLSIGINVKTPKPNCENPKMNPISGTVEFQERNNSIEHYALKCNCKSDKDFFPHFFQTNNGDVFYLDEYHHIWTDTMAAKSIRNKLFLRFHSSN